MKKNANKKSTHLNSLDGLRAIAALSVLFTHGLSAHLWSGYNISSIGVAVFFSLSGFLMGYLYLEKQPTLESVKNYLISRFSRIAPAYLFTILTAFVIYNYVDSGFVYDIDQSNITRHLLFSGNVSVFWSIPPEIQFYVFFILVWFATINYKYASYTLMFVLGLSILLMLYVRNDVPGTTLPSKIHFFMLGCILGFLRRKIHIDSKFFVNLIQILLFFTLVIYGIYLVYSHDSRYPYFILHYALLTAGTVFILSYQTFFTDKFFANRLLMSIGKWSFSLYLSHEAVIYFVTHQLNYLPKASMAVITVVAAIILSWAMFSLIEVPSQTILKRFLIKKS